MNRLAEVREHAERLCRELDTLSNEVEHSRSGPGVKSSMGREISEARARVQLVLEACSVPAPEGAVVLVPVAAPVVV